MAQIIPHFLAKERQQACRKMRTPGHAMMTLVGGLQMAGCRGQEITLNPDFATEWQGHR
jgi:hypothetical protein